MQEVAEEISATSATESLGMVTELAKREARIAQLGSRIEDLQVGAVWHNNRLACPDKQCSSRLFRGENANHNNFGTCSRPNSYTLARARHTLDTAGRSEESPICASRSRKALLVVYIVCTFLSRA